MSSMRDMSDLALIGGAAAMMGLGCFLGGRVSDAPNGAGEKAVSFSSGSKTADGERKKVDPLMVRQLSVKFSGATSVPVGSENARTTSASNDGNGKMMCVDGCWCAAHIAYQFSDVAIIYPITPSSPMGESVDAWSAAEKKNLFGQVLSVHEMQSEAGAAGAVHGCLSAGALSTTFTASQGLLLMVPNMYKIAGELMPCVFHVAARAIAGQGLSIFGDHSDIMAVRQTGFALLSAHDVQECQDMAVIAHLATLHAEVPFVSFFDGMRTSHEINKVHILGNDVLRDLLDTVEDKIQDHRDRALNPSHPSLKGTSQGPDVYMQMCEASNEYYNKVPGHVKNVMKQFGERVGRNYHLFEYYGHLEAEYVIVVMGAGSTTVMETVDYFNAQGKKYGLIKVRLFRPWVAEDFQACIPTTCQAIAVLDRCKENGSQGEPMFLDVSTSMQNNGDLRKVVGGRFGLGSKDLTPRMVAAVYKNLQRPEPLHGFTVGIEDDLTQLSLPLGKQIQTVSSEVIQCMFWGLGSDGTVGANKNAVKIIGDNTELNAQAYFAYSAHKSGGVTMSHLRFGAPRITAQYEITPGSAHFVACHNPTYPHKFRMLENLKDGGTFLLNTPASTVEELEAELPYHMKRTLAKKKAQVYVMNGAAIGIEVGLGKRINMIMQTAFFKLALGMGILPMSFEDSVKYMKTAIKKTYESKGQKVVQMNYNAVDSVAEDDGTRLIKIDYPSSWENAVAKISKRAGVPDDPSGFSDSIVDKMLSLEGRDISVKTMADLTRGGAFPTGTAKYEKRAIAPKVPVWIADNCTQCNYCAFVCPHAVIRPFLMDGDEKNAAPTDSYNTKRAKGAELAGLEFRIQVSTLDCTGCEVCANTCPDDALEMVNINKVLADKIESADGEIVSKEVLNWDYSLTLPEDKSDLVEKSSVKGSQFQTPLLEFSGACEGCGETPYIKLITQLFGERMIIANATGCSSIWGASAPNVPYTTKQNGRGPAWGNSLFEDGAEYGFGMARATEQRRNRLIMLVTQALSSGIELSTALRTELQFWLDNHKDGNKTLAHNNALLGLLKAAAEKPGADRLIKELNRMADMFPKVCQWIFGGDGWAYDIGFGGLDHVLASGVNVNVCVLDTEMYSNTGGQASKSTPMGATVKFALSGKQGNKKDLGAMAMSYQNVYVATVSLADMKQMTQAFIEAEAYDGPSLVLCYSPCIEQGLRAGMGHMVNECREAVECGYWPLYRWNPKLADEGVNPFTLDARKLKGDLEHFLQRDNRFINLTKKRPQLAAQLHQALNNSLAERHTKYKMMAAGVMRGGAVEEFDENTVLLFYGSETGTAERTANQMVEEFEKRDLKVKCMAADEVDLDDLAKAKVAVGLVATCGQGALPANIQDFHKSLGAGVDLSKTKYSIFGLGDTAYYFYCKAAKEIDGLMSKCGAQQIVDPKVVKCDGDASAGQGWEPAFEEWSEELWKQLGTPAPKEAEGVLPPQMIYNISSDAMLDKSYEPPHSVPVEVVKVDHITPEAKPMPDGRIRDFVHVVFKQAGGAPLKYALGDSLMLYPSNDSAEVDKFLRTNYPDLTSNLVLNIKAGPNSKGMLEHVPAECTVGDILGSCLDLFGVPTKRFYKQLERHASDPSDKKELGLLKKGEGKFKDWANAWGDCKTIADVITAFPKSRPPFEYLLEMIPQLQARSYSIASSPTMHPGEIHLCILPNTWNTNTGHRYGTAGNFVGNMVKAGDVVRGAIHVSAMQQPDDHSHPQVMVGIGSGLAPFMAFVQERAMAAKKGPVAPMRLYFGNRFEETEYLYRKELEAYEKAGWLTIRTAWTPFAPRDIQPGGAFGTESKVKQFYAEESKKTGGKVKFTNKYNTFVQDLVAQDVAELADLLHDQDGYIYCCGNRFMPPAVQKSLQQCFAKGKGISAEVAEEKIVDMYIKGRYNVESW